MGRAARLTRPHAAHAAHAPIVLPLVDYQAAKIAVLTEQVVRADAQAKIQHAEQARAEVFQALARRYPIDLARGYTFDDAQQALIPVGPTALGAAQPAPSAQSAPAPSEVP